MRKCLRLAFWMLVCSLTLNAQTGKTYPCADGRNVPQMKFVYGNDQGLSCIASQSAASRDKDTIKEALTLQDGANVLKLTLDDSKGRSTFLEGIEQVRLDKQTGAPPSSQGTTSVVSKGVASELLSLATEAGALTRTDSKTTSTFQVNMINAVRLLSGDTAFQDYCPIYDYQCDGGLRRALEGFSAGVSFYTVPGSAASSGTGGGSGSPTSNSSVLDASSQKVSGWNARYDFHVRRSKTSKDFAKNYKAEFESKYKDAMTNGSALAKAAETLTKPLVSCWVPPHAAGPCDNKGFTPYQNWLEEYADQLEAAPASDFNDILRNALKRLESLAKEYDTSLDKDKQAYAQALTTYLGNRDKLLADFVNPITYSVEVDNDRPTNQPSQTSAKFIVSAHPNDFQLTANFTIQWYDHLLRSNVNRIRDAQGAVQFDKQFAKDAAISPVLSAGYYYQYMVDKGLLTLPSTALAPGTSIPLPSNASELLNTTGSIHLGQAKVTFKTKNGISFPLALTFSNRTDLIKATDVRGNFGITYDLSSLISKQ